MYTQCTFIFITLDIEQCKTMQGHRNIEQRNITYSKEVRNSVQCRFAHVVFHNENNRKQLKTKSHYRK
jgi:hypothetical protein